MTSRNQQKRQARKEAAAIRAQYPESIELAHAIQVGGSRGPMVAVDQVCQNGDLILTILSKKYILSLKPYESAR